MEPKIEWKIVGDAPKNVVIISILPPIFLVKAKANAINRGKLSAV